MKKMINNLKFRSKMIWIFGIMFFFSTAISGISYYQYTSHDIEENFRVGAEDVLAQVADTLDLRLGVIGQRAKGMLTNYSFVVTLSDYLNNPKGANITKTMGTVSDFLRDLETGESLIYATYVYTDKGEFDNFVRMRDWQFHFSESEYYRSFEQNSEKSIRWFSPREDDVFQDDERVIPYVRRFSVQGYVGNQYLMILLKQSELEQLLMGKYEYFDGLMILDEAGNLVAGTGGMDTEALAGLAREKVADPDGSVLSGEYSYEGDTYLVTHEQIGENGWQIYGMKSRQTLLGSLKKLQNVILEMMGVVFLLCVMLILWLSHQLTASLRRLEKRMSCVQMGDLDIRFFYPYRDEVGSLAKSFNYMIGEIQSLVKKQEETIAELKKERDYAAEIQKQKRKAELRALQAQINPHFLYNTLNAITWQAADQGAEEISILSNSLGKFFRVSLSKGAEVIRLEEELEHVTSYLDIQRIRYHSKLTYRIEIDGQWMSCRVIKLILQPLVENSIYHGIKEKLGEGQILIYADQGGGLAGDILRLVVWDDGTGIAAEKLSVINAGLAKGETDRAEGYGIYNVNERIRLYYGEEYGLHYESVEGQWTKAVLTLPVRAWEVEACTE